MMESEEERDFSDMPDENQSEAEGQNAGIEGETPTESSLNESLCREMDIGEFLSEAWNTVMKNPMLIIVGYLVVSLITLISMVTIVGPIILFGPLTFGYIRVVQKCLDEKPPAFEELFSGFHDFTKSFLTGLFISLIGLGIGLAITLPFILLNLIPCLGTVLSFVILAAAGIFTHAFLYFAFPIAALNSTAPVEAIKQSALFCKKNLWPVVLLTLVTQIISSAGAVACGVGWILTVPLAMVLGMVAYNRYYLPKTDQTTDEL